MKNIITAILALICISTVSAQEKVTGMSNIKLYLDPGHALKENQGLYNYSEAEKTLRVAKAIREYLLTYTDMQEANIRLCREDDNTQKTLQQRTDEANAWGADFYYSIHSDASDTESNNSTLTMYGGWRVNGVVYEKTPYGGKDYGEILCPNLTGAMGISTRGNMADRTFYDGATTHTYKYPFLHVNRVSNMASLLSEAGFHTNPFQQSRNLNAEYKRLEGYAAYQSLVKYLSAKYGLAPVDPVQIGIATGMISDSESGIGVNGATVTITDGAAVKTYTTDSYQSLFKNYSTDPDKLHNGFYFVEGLTPGATVDVQVEAPGYLAWTGTVTIPATIGATTKDGLGKLDISMLNTTPPVVSSVEPADLSSIATNQAIILTFSRKMDHASVESALGFSPAATPTLRWTNDYTVRLNISSFASATNYVLTIDGSKAKNSLTNNLLDGDNDGIEGGNYVLNFRTSDKDITPPSILSYDPQTGSDQEVSYRPIVRIAFSEPLDESTIADNQIVVKNTKGETVPGTQKYTVVNNKSVLHFFFTSDLVPTEAYTVTLSTGIKDLFGNSLANGLQYTFFARPKETTVVTVLDNFNSTGTWWQPTGSGSTSGVDASATTHTIFSSETATSASTGSLMLNYLWDAAASSRLIRIHNTATSPKFSKDNVIQYYLFGDGSHTKFRIALRNGSAGSFYAQTAQEIDWVGWKLITWDIANDAFDHWLIGGTDDIPTGNVLNLSAIGVEPAAAPYLAFTPSVLYVDELQVVKLGEYVTTAIKQPVGDIKVISADNAISISASQTLTEVKVYSVSGLLVKSAQPQQSAYRIPTDNLSKGIYIVRVTAGNQQQNVKIVVK